MPTPVSVLFYNFEHGGPIPLDPLINLIRSMLRRRHPTDLPRELAQTVILHLLEKKCRGGAAWFALVDLPPARARGALRRIVRRVRADMDPARPEWRALNHHVNAVLKRGFPSGIPAPLSIRIGNKLSRDLVEAAISALAEQPGVHLTPAEVTSSLLKLYGNSVQSGTDGQGDRLGTSSGTADLRDELELLVGLEEKLAGLLADEVDALVGELRGETQRENARRMGRSLTALNGLLRRARSKLEDPDR